MTSHAIMSALVASGEAMTLGELHRAVGARTYTKSAVSIALVRMVRAGLVLQEHDKGSYSRYRANPKPPLVAGAMWREGQDVVAVLAVVGTWAMVQRLGHRPEVMRVGETAQELQTKESR